MTRVVVVTNDFPPRSGGIQSFVHALAVRLPASSVVVYAPRWEGCAEFDARQGYRVVRHPTSLMLPTRDVAKRAGELIRPGSTVVFGAAAPLGLLGGALRAAGAERVVMLTHGHEASWARLPLAGTLLRRIGAHADVVTYLGDYTRRHLTARIPAGKLTRLAPGVDTSVFRPGAGGKRIREALGLGERPVVVCVSRLVARKGQDRLIEAWPEVAQAVPEAELLLVGGGPGRAALERAAKGRGDIRFTGPVPDRDLPAYYDAGDVFAMPCRSRLGGLDVEGLGIVYLEASASGLPVVAGASGGAPDAVRHGETGLVVDGDSTREIAAALIELLANPEAARAMGTRGREWIERDWTWDQVAARFGELLTAPVGQP
ncbi:glycosyltransferase family 4 protein [Herbidospora sp. RD11066]